jgi:hypothetical protein
MGLELSSPPTQKFFGLPYTLALSPGRRLSLEVTLMSNDKSLGQRIGDAVDKAKDVAGDLLDGANEKRKEADDRTSANVHDAKAETTDNPLKKAGHNVGAAVDRAKAEGHDKKAEHHQERAEDRAKRKD